MTRYDAGELPADVAAWILWVAAWTSAYPELTPLSPRCPVCGDLSVLPMLSPAIYPFAVCPNDECTAFSWDPTIAPDVLLANQQRVDFGEVTEP